MSDNARPAPGFQVERTELSWERCSLALLANGVLALIRQHGPLSVSHYLAASVAALLAVAAVVLGQRRSRVIRGAVPGRSLPAAVPEVIALGLGTTALAVVMLVVVVVM